MKLFVVSWATLFLLVRFSGATEIDDEVVSKTCAPAQDGTCLESTVQEQQQQQQQQQQDEACTLFIAPSTIPNAGLGMFTAAAIQKGQEVGDGDIMYAIMDVNWHMLTDDEDSYFNPFRNFVWVGDNVGMQYEGREMSQIDGFCPGVAAASNCHLGLLNIERGDHDYDDQVGGHRALSPSAGSMTPYYNGRINATADIPSGGELFLDYGDSWFVERTEELGLVPLKRDYPQAEKLLRALRLIEDDFNLSTDSRHGLFSLIRHLPWQSRTMIALPHDYMHVDTIVATSIRSWLQTNATRSFNELQSTGRCVDNMRHGPSALPFAGRGAFATRNLPRGTIVTGTPLIHLPSQRLAVMLDSYDRDNGKGSFHLWINYCMSHRSSPVLLCPYGAGVSYINHNKTLVNVKLQWAPDGMISQNNSWFQMPPEDADFEDKKHLGMDYVATRDIQQGEELFLDYGNEWEEAWQDYTASWEQSKKDDSYVSATQWNRLYKNEPIRTQDEQVTDPYPEDLLIRCNTILENAIQPEDYQKVLKKTDELWGIFEKGYQCNILERNEDGTYNVELFFVDDVAQHSHARKHVPREMIAMMDAPYTTDMHRLDAFRQWIGIPDEIFPDAWITT